MSRLSLKNDFKDGDVLHGDEINTNNDATVAAVNDNFEEILKLQQLKADVTAVDNKLASKVDTTVFNQAIDNLNTVKANRSELNTKADKSEVDLKADKDYVDIQLNTKADSEYVSAQLNLKANSSDVTSSLLLKADKATTYTKEETDNIIETSIINKADKSEVYLKADKITVGSLDDLDTSDKSSIVNAINEVKEEGTRASNIDNKTIMENTDGYIQAEGVINKNGNDLAVKTWVGTKEDYDALETHSANILYYIIDDFEDPEVKSNKTTIINATSTDEQYPSAKAVYDAIQDTAGGGTGGTTDYTDLENKPSINGVELIGNKTSSDLGIKQDYTADDITFVDGETFQQKFDLGELTGPKGDTGAQGPAGTDGNDATINGQNAINLVAGENIDIAQDGSNVTISSTGSSGGATYTAGTNIEITEDNVINNTIPYKENIEGNVINLGQSTNPNNNNNNINIGLNVTNNSNNSVSVGNNTLLTGVNNIVIGNNSYMQHQNSIVIGHNAITSMKNQFTIGSDFMPIKEMRFNDDNTTRIQVTDFVNVINNLKTVTMSDNQLSLGSTDAPINEMKVVTSNGDKYIATTDLIDALETRIAALEAKIAELEGGNL